MKIIRINLKEGLIRKRALFLLELVHICMNSVEKLIEVTKEYDVISFDVFDTLIIRDLSKPSDLFLYEYGFIGKCLRIFAEMLARKKKHNGEVTLDDIYKYLPFDIKRELEFEKKICRANPLLFDFYNRIKDSKKIVAISDMYLSSETISVILKDAGYNIDIIYVSCDKGCNKETGELFNKFIEDNNVNKSKIIHIGDSLKSDYEGAKKAGIDSFLIEKHKNILSYRKINKKNYELNSFINHGLNDIDDPVEKIGYEVVGPIILGFCQWVHDRYLYYGFDKLFFLARDMRFTYENYKILYPNDDIDYLCVSRKSLNKSLENPSEFIEYLKNKKCYGNVSVVDTGWIGNAQVVIERFSKIIEADSDVGGLYLGTKNAYNMLKRSERSEGFYYYTKFEQFKCELFPPFMETLIGSNEKQVVDYRNGEPIFDREDSKDHTNLIKNGAKRFMQDWQLIKNNKVLNKKDAIYAFEKMFIKPLDIHIQLIGNLEYEDFKSSKIVMYSKEFNYLFHPRKWLNDLQDSGWKGAFFAKNNFLIKLLFPWYRFINSIRIYINNKQDIRKRKI